MKYRFSATLAVALTGALLITLAGCGIGGGNDTGRLSLSLTDKKTNEYDHVFVTIKQIDVHAENDMEGSWTTIAQPNRTIDLMTLANGVRQQLALVDLSSGYYTQMRLIIGDQAENDTFDFANYVVDKEGVSHEMKIPSGMQTGVKLVQGFTINENGTTELTLDFDASRSVVVAGKSGKYLLKPTIHVLDDALVMIISGTVTTTDDPPVPLEGAVVSLQVYDDTQTDLKDQVVIQTSTITNVDGAYKFFFAVDPINGATFNVVATADGYLPGAERVTVMNGDAPVVDFALGMPAEVGTVPITITGAETDVPVTFSIRQQVDLGGTLVFIEVKSISVVNETSLNVDLPVGDYTIVASTEGKETQTATITVVSGTNTEVPIIFP